MNTYLIGHVLPSFVSTFKKLREVLFLKKNDRLNLESDLRSPLNQLPANSLIVCLIVNHQSLFVCLFGEGYYQKNIQEPMQYFNEG